MTTRRIEQTLIPVAYGCCMLLVLLLSGCQSSPTKASPIREQTSARRILVIPKPKSLTVTGPPIDITGGVQMLVSFARGSEGPVFRRELQRLGLPARGPTTVFFDISREKRPPEHYSISVRDREILVQAPDELGIRWASATLAQLVYKEGGKVWLPRVQVEDYPTLRVRGAHLLTGKNALPFHKKLVDNIFARFKLNTLILQCEQAKWDTTGASAPEWAMSKADLKEDVRHARAMGMQVIPLINSVGHMDWILEDHREWAEDPQTPFAARADSQELYSFLSRLHGEVLKTFNPLLRERSYALPVQLLHIGGDEVALRGRYPHASKLPSLAAAYSITVSRLHKDLTARGVKVGMWADMLLAEGESADASNAPSAAEAKALRRALPKDLILFDWQYKRAPAYDSSALLQKAGFKRVAGATWWRPENINNYARSLAAQDGLGFVQTTWAGHESSEDNLRKEKRQFVAFVIAAEAGWNGGFKKLDYDPEEVFDAAYARP